MKKILLIIAFICSAFAVNAQTGVTWNAELGLGASGWVCDGSDNSNALFNPRVGVKIDVPLSGLLSFQTGLYWVSKGASLKEYEDLKTQVNQNYFQMPLLAAFHVGTASNFDLVLTVGPYIGYGINGKAKIDAGDYEITWNTFDDIKFETPSETAYVWQGLRRFDAGLQAGLGFDFEDWTAGINGEVSLCRIYSDGPRNVGFYASIAYKF